MTENNLIETLQDITEFQSKAIAEIRKRDMVFNNAPFREIKTEADRWEHLAFWLYTYICEIDMKARQALEEGDSEGPGHLQTRPKGKSSTIAV